MSIARRKDLAMVAIGLLAVVVDQLTKRWIVTYFTSAPRPPVPLLGQVLELQYLQNTGVAFSLLEGTPLKFLFIAIAITMISWLYWRNRTDGSLLLKVAFGLILGGAAGNLIDRFTRQYVVDFIHFQIPGRFNFAVFNLADSSITVGVLLLAYLLWRQNTMTPEHDGARPADTLAVADAPTGADAMVLPASSPSSAPQLSTRIRRGTNSGR